MNKQTIPWKKILKEFNSVPEERFYLRHYICNASVTFSKIWGKLENRLEIIKNAEIFLETYKDKTIYVSKDYCGLVLFLRHDKPWDDLPEVRKDFLEYMVRETQS